MKTLLQIKASIFGDQGQSSQLAERFVARWREAHPEGRVIVRDLDANPVPHLTAARFQGFFAKPEERTPEQVEATREADELIAELKDADVVVLGLPMYNFSLPSTLKAYFDHVARAGTTFRYTAKGPEGLVGDKPVHVFAARGGQYEGTGMDTQTPLVRTFLGFLGMKDVRFVYAEGLARSGDVADQALGTARAEIDAIAV
ncbi:MAG: FMN-dependent NADH-azoreductase [Gammaproteobacteria bacterium]|nr:FMN-dependent NADH-azoreductase [Gammaproteobacteria bacterium]